MNMNDYLDDKDELEKFVDEEPIDNELKDDTANKKKGLKKEVIEWIKSIALAAVTALVIVKFIFSFTVVEGVSMMPTLNDKDRLIELKIDKWFRDYKRGDIVVIKDKVKTKNDYYVKRIVALGNDEVQITGGEVYINGEKLDEGYIVPGMYTEGEMSIKVPEGEVFVLGDNRLPRGSRDSRIFGTINEKNIDGRCVVRVFPFSRISILK